jgi:predicted 2-oxoglutarate/Fe(II)-dependent dioxygenase YbiX
MFDELLILNDFIDQDECDFLIKIFNRQFVDQFGYVRKMKEAPQIEEIKPILFKILEKTKEVANIDELYISDYLINSYQPGFSMGVHTDLEDGKEHFSVSTVLYLNNQFQGGDIVFPNIPARHHPKAGDLAIFPSVGEKYIHGVEQVISGERFVMPVWTTIYKEQANKFVHSELDN